MQVSINIIKKNKINESFRTEKVMNDFDYQQKEVVTELKGTIITPKKWNIGCIVGSSGTGKSTIAKEKFGKYYISGFEYDDKSVLDNMNENCTTKEITEMFYKVGFGSVPEWFKPYNVLSTGEKMRVDLARALLQQNKIAFDEFTSVVDRTVAKNIIWSLYKSKRWKLTASISDMKIPGRHSSIESIGKSMKKNEINGRFKYIGDINEH